MPWRPDRRPSFLLGAVAASAYSSFDSSRCSFLPRCQPGLFFFSSFSRSLNGLRCRWRWRGRFVFCRGSRWPADRFRLLFLWLSLLSTSLVSAPHDLVLHAGILQKDLTAVKMLCYAGFAMSSGPYTTEQAAEQVGISRQTLQAWIRTKKITPPKPTLDGARSKRLWTESDLARLRKVKEKIYWTGQGRPRKRR